jgi:hypothetical protein
MGGAGGRSASFFSPPQPAVETIAAHASHAARHSSPDEARSKEATWPSLDSDLESNTKRPPRIARASLASSATSASPPPRAEPMPATRISDMVGPVKLGERPFLFCLRVNRSFGMLGVKSANDVGAMATVDQTDMRGLFTA